MSAGFVPFHRKSLTRGPLLRTVALRCNDDDHVIVMAMHHIVSDGWTMTLLIHELLELYDAGRSGRRPALESAPLQYTDYCAWQHEWRASGRSASQLGFWTRQLTHVRFIACTAPLRSRYGASSGASSCLE